MRTSLKVIFIILILLIGARIYLPFWLTDYVNRELSDIPGYKASIAGVELNLYRGAYQIEGLEIEQIKNAIPAPFVKIDFIDFSVQWDALFHGSLVGEVEFTRPIANFGATQTGTNVDWTEQVKELMPIRINRFAIVDGKVAYRDFESDPEVNISLDNLWVEATNFSNVEDRKERLPSTINGSATSIGGGKLNITAKANVLKKIPDFDLNASFEGVSLPALNDFAKAYSNLDFEKGIFNVYTEMAVSDGILEGYIKPIMTDVKILDVKEDSDNLLTLAWEGVAGALMNIFKNQPKDQFATQVPLQGDLNNPDTSIWPAIGNIFKNAFVGAFQKQTDDSINFENVIE